MTLELQSHTRLHGGVLNKAQAPIDLFIFAKEIAMEVTALGWHFCRITDNY
jgi:hypothetical protein